MERHFIRKLLKSDYEKIVDIVKTTNVFKPEEIDITKELMDEYLSKGESSGYYFLVSENDGEVLGFACYGPTPATIGTFDLYWIATDPNSGRKGVATELLFNVENELKKQNARLLIAETADTDDYAKARNFYISRGFDLTAHISDYYKPNDGMVILVKKLAEK
jgi:ribosomal protein S18 acetylase RimI-like enzyme